MASWSPSSIASRAASPARDAPARVFAARSGVHMAKPLTGYDRGPDGRLVPNGDAHAVAEAFRHRGTGANWTELARFLNEEGVRPYSRKNGGQWTASSVRAMLRNRGYLGEISVDDVVNPDTHPPLVTLAEFEAAQASRGTPIIRSSEPSLLAGLVRCGSCRHVMKRKRLRAGELVYRCGKHHSSGTCPTATVYASVVEPYVERLLLSEAASRSYRPERATTAIEQAEREVADAEAELRAWATDPDILRLRRDFYVEGLQAREHRLKEAEARRRQLFADSATVLPSWAELRSLWPSFTTAEKRRVLGSVFDAIVVRPNGRRRVDERVVVLLRATLPATCRVAAGASRFGPSTCQTVPG
jgi:Recombinase zinc beta ribbon domain/Recombinase